MSLTNTEEEILQVDLPGYVLAVADTIEARITVDPNGNNSAVVRVLAVGSNILSATNPVASFPVPRIPSEYIKFTNFAFRDPGDTRYNPVTATLESSGGFGNTLQIGQEEYYPPVINLTGAIIPEGIAVRVSGYDGGSDQFTVVPALADTVENAEVAGIVTTELAVGGSGLVAKFGRVNDLDTSLWSPGDVLFLSSTVPGGLTNVRPPIASRLGVVGKIDVATGWIEADVRDTEVEGFANYKRDSDLIFAATGVSEAISLSVTDGERGITSLGGGVEFRCDIAGAWLVSFTTQVTRDGPVTGANRIIDAWLELDSGGGYAAIPNTLLHNGEASTTRTSIGSLPTCIQLSVGDLIRIRGQVNDLDMKLEAIPAVPPLPAAPSATLTFQRDGI